MPFKKFDRSKLNIKSISERIHDVNISVIKDINDPILLIDNPNIDIIARDIIKAKEKKATVLMMYGAHVIRTGCGLFMIELMKRGLINHFATNGAGAIHDYEFSLIGNTCESVAKYISEGQFGLWKEDGILNDIIETGVTDGLGAGEAIGRYIWENNLPYREKSVLALGYKLHVPCTVHIGIGNDIVHEHPNSNGASLGEASMSDFLIYANSISNLENGVFLNFGSAVTGPEVYLKALSMARNVAHQNNEKICHFTTAVFDLIPIEETDYSKTPLKTDPHYYFRPWKTILVRTVSDGGKSFYVTGDHASTLPSLARRVFSLENNRR
ncbi:MAG TPA: hypothetical protein VIK72_14955 [Clostridiaceae bacterium]